MPELPEVETVRARLGQVLPGRVISQIKILRKKSFQGEPELILQEQIKAVERRAKLILFKLTGKYGLLIHLKMTGQLVFVSDEQKVGGGHPTADWVQELPGDHTRVIIDFTDDSTLFFNDMRVFGWIMVADDQTVQTEFAKYGPDVNTSDFNAKYLAKQLANRTISIKQALLIGKIVGGIGNIYACEALYEARLDPRRSAKNLSLAELKRLVKKLKEIINKAIQAGGTTYDGKYVHVDGLSGSFQKQLKVYGQAGEPCPGKDCAGQVKKIKLGGRGTYFCEKCQQ